MFEGLSEKLSGIFDTLTRRGALSEADVSTALREVRRALLEADVALEVVRSFTDKVRAKAVGCVDYLTKPVDRATLIKTLRRYLTTPGSG